MAHLSNFIIMTSWWARWRFKLLASRLFTQSFIQAQIKQNIKAPRHWPLCGEFTGDRWIPAQRASNAENVSIWWRHLAYDVCESAINHSLPKYDEAHIYPIHLQKIGYPETVDPIMEKVQYILDTPATIFVGILYSNWLNMSRFNHCFCLIVNVSDRLY